jgi:carbamoyl-phosphate synthase large subunit
MQKITRLFKSILVSGASGDIGIGIGRILKSENFENVYGCDINEDSWGVCVFDNTLKVPRADADNYIQVLISVINKLKIDLFIPSSEAEIKVLINQREPLDVLLGCQVLIADTTTVNIALDKLSTANFLKQNNINAPWTMNVDQELPLSLPCIFKPISGQGSKGLEIIKDNARAKVLLNSTGYIFQELLTPDDQEYTCGVFRSKAGELRLIHMNRTLSGGFTGKGTIVESKEIDLYVSSIAKALNVVGAVNMQLRLTAKGPVLFEINPRLSSTVVFRHKLGFEDLIWALEDLANLPIRKYDKPKAGIQFYRGLSEYFKN